MFSGYYGTFGPPSHRYGRVGCAEGWPPCRTSKERIRRLIGHRPGMRRTLTSSLHQCRNPVLSSSTRLGWCSTSSCCSSLFSFKGSRPRQSRKIVRCGSPPQTCGRVRSSIHLNVGDPMSDVSGAIYRESIASGQFHIIALCSFPSFAHGCPRRRATRGASTTSEAPWRRLASGDLFPKKKTAPQSARSTKKRLLCAWIPDFMVFLVPGFLSGQASPHTRPHESPS